MNAVQGSPSEIEIMKAESMARLAVLERLRDKAKTGGRAAMLASVEQMISAELRALNRLRTDSDATVPPGPRTSAHAGVAPAGGPSERPGGGS